MILDANSGRETSAEVALALKRPGVPSHHVTGGMLDFERSAPASCAGSEQPVNLGELLAGLRGVAGAS